MRITNGSLGPVKTETGSTPCVFTGNIAGKTVVGTYDPTMTRSQLSGEVKTILAIDGKNFSVKFAPIGPYGLCGKAEQIS